MDDTSKPIAVPASSTSAQLRAQLRLIVAALAGALVLRKVLPAELVNDTTIDLAAGALIYLGAAAWSWIAERLKHGALKTIAGDPRVPDAVAFVADRR